jgi:A/G-specific adenine glycosylase
MSEFARTVITWQGRHGRHDLPWQQGRDPYRIWLSEVMLQQTQVSTVLPYFARFIERFPNLASLALAPQEEVMKLWSGLGYYSRARNLHRCARTLMQQYGGEFPNSSLALQSLPGIGRSTAAAVAAFAFGERAAILDGNVKRVFCRVFGVQGFPGESAVLARLWAIAERELPAPTGQPDRDAHDIAAYTQGLMDLGATLCTRVRPRCAECPVNDTCYARATGQVAQLPTPRPRRETPERQTVFLVILRAGQVLLQLRPAKGIWGGLLSLPECEPAPAEVVHRRAEALSGWPLSGARSCNVIRHSFTHYRLVAQPLIFTPTRGSARFASEPPAPESQGTEFRWIDLREVSSQALPAPIRVFLGGLVGQVRSPDDRRETDAP